MADNTPRGSLRIFLVDDHEVVRRGLASILAGEPDLEVVGQASSCEQARNRISALCPDVAIVDMRLPDGDGVELCRDVLARSPELRCLVLTSFEDDEAMLGAIMAGASGYVLKHSSADDVLRAVRTVGAGGSLLDPGLATNLLERIRRGPFQDDHRLASLTKQEHRILLHVADGLSNREIAEEVFLAEATVKNYVSSILSKLGLRQRTQAAVLANELRRPRSA